MFQPEKRREGSGGGSSRSAAGGEGGPSCPPATGNLLVGCHPPLPFHRGWVIAHAGGEVERSSVFFTTDAFGNSQKGWGRLCIWPNGFFSPLPQAALESARRGTAGWVAAGPGHELLPLPAEVLHCLPLSKPPRSWAPLPCPAPPSTPSGEESRRLPCAGSQHWIKAELARLFPPREVQATGRAAVKTRER